MLLRCLSRGGISFALLLGLATAAEVPRRSPEFAVSMLTGNEVLLSSYRGKVVALVFLLTYCPHCQQTTGILSKLQNEYGPRGFQVLGSSIEDMARMMLPDFIKRFQPSFPVGYSNRDSVLEYLQHSPMFKLMMPQVVLIDRQGTIRGQYSGDEPFLGDNQEKNLRDKIEPLLNEKTVTQQKKAAAPARKKTPSSMRDARTRRSLAGRRA